MARACFLMLVLIAFACSGINGARDSYSDSESDIHLDVELPSDIIDTIDVEADRTTDCTDDFQDVIGGSTYVSSRCVEDPSVALVEVQLSNMSMQYWVGSAPARPFSPTDDEVKTLIEDELLSNGCVRDADYLPTSEIITHEHGPFLWGYLPPSDPAAGAVFDGRSGLQIFTFSSDWLSQDRRCAPVGPLISIRPEYELSGEPESCHPSCETSECESLNCIQEVNSLNYWGDVWVSACGGCWFERTYEAVYQQLLHSSVVAAFSACGPFDVFLHGMVTPGGAHCGEIDDLKAVFILAGYMDVGLLD